MMSFFVALRSLDVAQRNQGYVATWLRTFHLTILEDIVTQKKIDLAEIKRKVPLSSFADLDQEHPRDFAQALMNAPCGIIAEIKKASPSKGLIRAQFDVPELAQTYETNGATCISVVTESHFFQGADDYLRKARAQTSLPLLRKDFVVDAYQIAESRALGADCILLIVALLDDQQLLDFCQQAQDLQMSVLVESHTEEEFQRALRLPTPLMGVNNRDLHSFVTDLNTSIRLAKDLPKDKILISESGINHRADIVTLQDHGISHFLIGESLMREADVGAKLQALLG